MPNPLKYTFKGKGNKDYNDVSFSPETAFDIISSSYTFIISPKSKYWRFGIRFGMTIVANYGDQRYNNQELKHIEIAAGNRTGKVWVNPQKLFLQEYFIHGSGGVLYNWSSYKPYSDVIVDLNRVNESSILVTCKSEGCPDFSTQLPLINHRFFKLFAWADGSDFEIDCTIRKSFRITLNQVKALSGQEIKIDIQDLMVFFGRNNCGKTSIILGASHYFMNNGDFVMDYLGPNRFSTSDNLNMERFEKVEDQQEKRKGRNSYTGDSENVGPDPMQELSIQDKTTRDRIISWFNENIEEFKISKKDLSEYVSTAEAKIGNQSPKVQGTGVRSILSIVTQLFNPYVKFLCIDEPELSLEPRVQKILFELIKKASRGDDDIPKKTILIATHSHIFLDKEAPQNNFKVTRNQGSVKIDQITNESQLQSAVYHLLGNNPSDLFFPANIVVVEGRSDHEFLRGVYDLLKKKKIVSEKKVVFHFVAGIEKAKLGVIAVNEMLKTQAYIPVYSDKVCGLFDAPNNDSAKKVIADIIEYFKDDGSRFTTLTEAAIEYYYPLQIVRNLISQPDLSNDDFLGGTRKYLEQVKSDKVNHSGDFFGLKIDKVSLARELVELLLQHNDPNLVDSTIIKLLKKADELAY